MGYEADLLTPAPPAPSAPPGAPATPAAAPQPWEQDLLPTQPNQPKVASGPIEAIRAGYQGSATGLAIRGKLPELVLDPQASKWWERALAGTSQIVSELPEMVVGAAAGAPVGAAAGGAVGSAVPGIGTAAGTAVGTVLGTGAGMFGVPAALRESLIQAYRAGDVKTVGQFMDILKEVAKTTAKEATVGAVTFGAGGVAARVAGKALAPAIGTSITVPTAIRAIGAADVTAQIAAMTTVPAAMEGRLPHLQDILDAAIVVGGLKGAHTVAERVARIYEKTGRTPAEVVADAKTEPTVAEDLTAPEAPRAAGTPPPDPLRVQEQLFTEVARLDALEAVAKPEDQAELVHLRERVATLEAQLEPSAKEATFTASLKRVYDDIETQMKRAGRPEDEAAAIAAIERERYRSRADRLGQDPWELYREHGLRIRGPEEPPSTAPSMAKESTVSRETLTEPKPAIERKPPRPLTDPDVRAIFEAMAGEAGWETVGGRFDPGRYVEQGGTLDEFGRATKLGVVAFTKWVPRAEWWPNRPGPGKLNEAQTKEAIRKALAGEKLKPSEQRAVDYMRQVASDRAEAEKELGSDRFEAVGREIADEGLDPTTRNVLDADKVARAAEIDPDAVERAAIRWENDDAAFMAEVRKVLGEQTEEDARRSEADQREEPLFQSDRTLARDPRDPENLPATVGGGRPAQGWARATRISREGRPLAVHRGQQRDLSPADFTLEALGFNSEHPTSGFGVFFTTSGDVAAKHGEVAQFYLDIRNPKVIKADRLRAFDSVEDAYKFREDLRKQGFDGLIISAQHLGTGRVDIAAFSPEQVIPLNQAPRVFYQTSPKQERFYSELARQVETLQLKEGTAEQWKGTIANLKGVKKAELEATGLTDWLDLQAERGRLKEARAIEEPEGGDVAGMHVVVDAEGNALLPHRWASMEDAEHAATVLRNKAPATDKVTKQQVQDFLQQNGVKVEEVLLGARTEGATNEGRPQLEDRGDLADGFHYERDPHDPEEEVIFYNRDGDQVDYEDMTQPAQQAAERLQQAVTQQASLEALTDRLSNLGWEFSTRRHIPGGREALFRPGENGVWMPLDQAATRRGVTPEIRELMEDIDHETTGLPEAPPSNIRPTKFGQYTLPGGENYRELLLTLPEKAPPQPQGAMTVEQAKAAGWKVDLNKYNEFTGQTTYRVLDGDGELLGMRSGAPGRWTDDAILAQIAKDQARQEEREYAQRRRSPQARFSSSHFDEPNILAHVRFNDRVDADGKKVLFIEEFQSDWAQQGKKRGFGVSDAEQARMTEIMEEQHQLRRNRTEETERRIAELEVERNALARRMNEGVARAPFVTKTEAWVGLSLKRMIAWAAENGYDRVAWTRGEQQVERYTGALRKAVDEIEWTKTDKGVQIVGYKGGDNPNAVSFRERSRLEERANQARHHALEAVRDNDNLGFDTAREALGAIWEDRSDWSARWDVRPQQARDAIHTWIERYLEYKRAEKSTKRRQKVVDTTEREDALSDAIGKTMAKQILESPEQSGTISGEGIRVDDTGMASFYDRMVPNIANDILKKLGGGKVGETEFEMGSKKRDRGEDVQIRPNTRQAPLFRSFNRNDYDAFAGAEPFKNGDEPIIADKAQEILVGEHLQHRVEVEVVVSGESAEFHGMTGEEPFALQIDIPNTIKSADEARDWLNRVWRQTGFWSALQLVHGELPGDVKTSKQPSFDITPEMREKVVGKGQPLFKIDEDIKRGSYTPSERLIHLMQANKSTALHELGHDWLEEMRQDAARPDAPEQIKADWETLRRQLAIPAEGDIPVAAHEQWARSVELYVGEGKAPSAELASVFARFRQWLLDIYRSLTELNVEINPEMREVMDRMLATDEQIAAAKEMGVPRAYVDAAKAETAYKIVPGFKAEQASIQPFADELPRGPGEAPGNSHLNYKYMNGPLDMKLTLQRMAEIDQQNIQEQRGGTAGVKSWEEANTEQLNHIAEILQGTPEQVQRALNRYLGPPPEGRVDRRLGELKKLTTGAAKDSVRLRDIILEKGPDATVQEQLEYMGSLERMRMIQAEFLAERAGVARALNALKDTTEGSGEIGRMLDAIGYGEEAKLYQAAKTPAEVAAEMKARLDEILLNYRGKTVYDIAKLHKEIGTLKGSYKFAKETTKATTWEMLVEGWKSSLLSGPVTHTTNLFGTAAFHGIRPLVDVLAASVGMLRGAKVGMGENDRASMQEAVARMTGWLGGTMDGLKVGYHTFKADEATGKTESYREAIPGRAGELIRIPLRLMSAEDAIVTTMYSRGELKALAVRQAFEEKLNPMTREFAERVDRLVDNPTPELKAAVTAEATRMTFNAPLGEKGRVLQLMINKWNLQWMMPFVRTPLNIFKEVTRMTPFAPAIGEWRADFAKGGVARDKAIAELTLGTGIMALAANYAFEGMLTGTGDPDPGKRRAKAGVWQPGSVLLGDTYYEIQRIQPMGTLLVAAADMAMVWDHMTDEEMDKVPKMLAQAFANAVTNQTFLQGITNVVNAMSDPKRFFPQFGRQMAGSLVPNIVGQTTTMTDPYVREVNSMLEAIQARIPGFREQLLAKQDWLGEKVETKERAGLISPVRMQKVSGDKVRLEADRLGISVGDAPKKVHIGKGTGKLGDVEITPEQRNKFREIAGKLAHDVLTPIVNGPQWDALPELAKRRIFARVMTGANRAGAIAAFPPNLRDAAALQINQKMQAELQPMQTTQ